jgi:hypothetical protein
VFIKRVVGLIVKGLIVPESSAVRRCIRSFADECVNGMALTGYVMYGPPQDPYGQRSFGPEEEQAMTRDECEEIESSANRKEKRSETAQSSAGLQGANLRSEPRDAWRVM